MIGLATARGAWRWRSNRPGSTILRPTAPQAYRTSSGIPRYTLTAVGNRDLRPHGRRDALALSNPNRGGGSSSSSYIIALDWSTQGKLLWLQRSSDLILPNRPADRINRSVNFEGTPVGDSRNVSWR